MSSMLINAFLGGLLLGGATLLMYATLGRIAGVSGITFNLLSGDGRGWKLAFLAGIVGGGWIAIALGAPLPAMPAVEGKVIGLLIVSGLLVGFGTQLGNGCTSGHGLCGLARLSKRSLVAVLVFMAVGIAVATLVGSLA